MMLVPGPTLGPLGYYTWIPGATLSEGVPPLLLEHLQYQMTQMSEGDKPWSGESGQQGLTLSQVPWAGSSPSAAALDNRRTK